MKSKRSIVLVLCAVCALLPVLAGCARNAPAKTEAPAVDELDGTGWLLTGIKDNGSDTALDRAQMEADGIGEWYSLSFDKEESGAWRISGVAGNNNYRAPCEWGDGSSVQFGQAASTLMFAFKEFPALKEHDYFVYLGNVRSWALTDGGSLELRGADDDGAGLVLTFEKKPE